MKNDVARATERLYALLPAIHRIRDVAEGGPLEALVAVLAEQLAIVEEDLLQRWDDHFIETCAPWVVPYLGELLGNTPLFDASRIRQPDTAARLFSDLVGPIGPSEVAVRNRADVAKTIGFRRRKATRPMLEDLALAVTGWPAHVVEMFQRLGWSQCVRNHLRMESVQCVDLRRIEPLDRIDGPFDSASHNVDVRPPETRTGWYHLPNVAFFLWRLRSHSLSRADGRRVGAAGDHRYRVSQLGHDLPLFSRFVPEEIATRPFEARVPGPIRRAAFFSNIDHFYGEEPDDSLLIISDGVPVPVGKIRCMNLSAWAQPPDDLVGIDVRSGRISFGPDVVPSASVEVSYHYGFSADLGGGAYARSAWRVSPELAALELTVEAAGAIPGSFTTVGAALTAWSLAGKPNTIITIADDQTYAEPISIELADDRWLAIEAAERRRPHLLLDGPLSVTGDHATSTLTFSGLLIEGAIHVEGQLGRLRLLHTTLVPGLSLTGSGLPATTEPSVIASSPNPSFELELAFSITGPLRVPNEAEAISIFDSIVDGVGTAALDGWIEPSAALWTERSTFIGAVDVREVGLVTEGLFTAPLTVHRRQEGCVRFSFVPNGSVTPRRFQCQPDLEIAAEIERTGALTDAEKDAVRDRVVRRVVPAFTSSRYGQPAYAQLHASSPIQIREGAEDRAEMGAFCHLKQPQRRANLLLRLGEYLPVGLTPAILFVT